MHPLLGRFKARAFGGPAGQIFRGMVTLALGAAAARLIGIAAMPLLTRLYSPEDFGVLAVFTALVAILAPLVTLRYPLALPLPRRDGTAMNLLVLSFGLMLGTTLLIGTLLWAFGGSVLGLVSMEILAPWWWLIALGVLAAASYEMLTLWATRRRAYRVIAQTQVCQSAAGNLVKLALGVAGLMPAGLLIGQVVAQGGGIGSLLRAFARDVRQNWRHVRRLNIARVAQRHRGFPVYRLPSQILLVFSKQAPVVLAVAMFGAATGGQLSLALAVLAVPLALIGGSMGKALYGEAARLGMREPERLLILVKATQLRLFAMAVVPAAALFLFGPSLFVAAFGADWEMAGRFASLLSLYLLFQFTSAPLMQVINLLDAQHVFLIINIIRALLLITLAYIAHTLGLRAEAFVTAYSGFAAGLYSTISIYVIYRLSRTAKSNA